MKKMKNYRYLHIVILITFATVFILLCAIGIKHQERIKNNKPPPPPKTSPQCDHTNKKPFETIKY